MPAGDLIAADWQGELNGLLFGAGTDYELGAQGIDGLGNPKAKTADVDLDGADGAFGAPDYMSVRVLLIPFEIVVADAGAAFTSLRLLSIAFEPSTIDVELHLRLPGWGHVFWTGRPRSLDTDTSLARAGTITAIGEFHALNPVAQTA